MSDRRPPPLPRQPSSPELVGIVTPDQPERGAVRHHPGVEDAPQAPPQRRGTLPGGMAAIPALTSGEFAPTLPAPNPLQKKTWRVPTPPSAALLARRTPVPPPDDPPAPQSAADGQLAAVLAERDRLRGELAQAQRDARAAAEAKLETYPPKVEQRIPTPVPSSAPEAKVDRAVGSLVRVGLRKLWPLFVAAAGIGGGATAVLKPSADPAKADATLANVEAIHRDLGLVRTQLDGVLDREATRDDFTECLYEQQADYFEQLLPSQQKLVTGQLQRTWVDRCRTRRPKR